MRGKNEITLISNILILSKTNRRIKGDIND